MVIYKPGKENILAEFLSRFNEDNNELDPDEQNDYHDQLVALTEVSTEKEKNESTEE